MPVVTAPLQHNYVILMLINVILTKRHVTYIYSERNFIGYRILFTKHKKLFLFLRNRPFNNTLTFADFWWRQQKLEELWQQTIYQQTPFVRFYQLTKFQDQKVLHFWSIFGRGRTTQPSQKTCNLYIFWKNILLAI